MSRKSRERRPKPSERPPAPTAKKSDVKRARKVEEFITSPKDAARVIALDTETTPDGLRGYRMGAK